MKLQFNVIYFHFYCYKKKISIYFNVTSKKKKNMMTPKLFFSKKVPRKIQTKGHFGVFGYFGVIRYLFCTFLCIKFTLNNQNEL